MYKISFIVSPPLYYFVMISEIPLLIMRLFLKSCRIDMCMSCFFNQIRMHFVCGNTQENIVCANYLVKE
jgi:hypothetical protein